MLLFNTSLLYNNCMNNISNDILGFLKLNGIMTLATCDSGDPWCCTVYYAITDEFLMYIVTDPDSKHGWALKNNRNVSICVYDSHTKIIENKKGVQATGEASQVKDLAELANGLMLWHKANPGIETKITVDDLKKLKDTRLYKIQLKYAKFFNKELYGDDAYGEITI